MSAVAILAIVLAAAAMLLVSWGSFTPSENTPERLVQPVFNRIFGSILPAPVLKVSSAYGYPTFEIVFPSRTEMDNAGPLIADFKRELNVIFRGYGSRERGFDAEMATFFTYRGQMEEVSRSFHEWER